MGGVAQLLLNQGNNVTGTAVAPQPRTDKMLVMAKYGTSVTGNVVIQGRTSTNMDWDTLHTFTNSDSVELPSYPLVRATTNTITGGTGLVSADVYWR